MRLFEVLILLIDLLVIGWGFVPGKRPKWTHLLPITAVLLIPLHLFIEGYRWQMAPAYGLTGLVLLLEARFLQKTSGATKRGLTIAGSVVGVLVWLAAFGLPYLLPVPKLPEPTGAFAIGSITYYLRDAARDEIYTDDPNDKRELMVQVWYPAQETVRPQIVPYLPDVEVAGPAIATRLDLPPYLLDHLNLAYTHAADTARIAAGSFPVIVFSHGLQGFRNQNTAMVEELVSHGYVVVTIDHTYGNVMTVFPDGRIAPYAADQLFPSGDANPEEGRVLIGVWAEDIAFVLDQMALWNGEGGVSSASFFSGHLDLSKVGVFGHSTGGGTALEFCGRDSRCMAGIGLDAWVGPVADVIIQNGLPQPFLFMNTPVWLGPENAARGRELYGNLQNAAYLIAIEGTEHYNFSDLPLLSPITPQLKLAGSIDNTYGTEILNAYTLAFFDSYLKGDGNALLQETPPYPEVQLETRNAEASE